MKLDSAAEISEDKLVRYLLARRPKNDKSAFFAAAGYTHRNWERLRADLRDQILPLEAHSSRTSVFGDLYTIQGSVRGPNGRVLEIVSVWIVEAERGATRLVTVYPARGIAHEL